MPHNLKVMSVLNLYPQKLGSFEEYTLLLSQHLAYPGGQSILVFDRPPRRHFDLFTLLRGQCWNPSLLILLAGKVPAHFITYFESIGRTSFICILSTC